MANPIGKDELFSRFLQSLCYSLFVVLVWLQVSSIKLALAAGSRVEYLPGFEGPLPFELETGYYGVGESENVQLFYYFVKSQSNPSEDPLLLWINGGPGCSALLGFLFEIGPIKFEAVEEFYDNELPKLVLNPYTWTEAASIIFLDLPVGTGFSYAKTPEALHSTDMQAREQAYELLRKFLVDHPEFTNNPFYVAGDSFAGLIVPLIAQLVSKGNEIGNEPSINLKGYSLGNPVTRSPIESTFVVPFAHRIGLISDELHEDVQRNCKGDDYFGMAKINSPCYFNMQAFNKTTENIEFPNILEPHCPYPDAVSLKMFYDGWQSQSRNFIELPRLPVFRFRCDGYRLMAYWCNQETIREILHVHKGSKGQWVRCNLSLPYDVKVRNSVPFHAYLSEKGYRSLVYSGDHDLYVPYPATETWINSLNFSIVDDWRPWNVGGQVAGFTRSYANRMTFATVKGGGHTAPEYKPVQCKAMFTRWMNHEPL